MRSIKFDSLVAKPESLRPRPSREIVAMIPPPPPAPPVPAPQPPPK